MKTHRERGDAQPRGAHWTSGPPALGDDNPPNEAQRLLPLKTLVHALADARPAHHAVLPLPLSQQHQLHPLFIQRHLERKTAWPSTSSVTELILVCSEAYQWDRVNVPGWEGEHQPAQMFHITNSPFSRLPGKQAHPSSHYSLELM